MRGQIEHLYNYPRGFMLLCAVEMGERFAFYGMRSLLILYMTSALSLPDSQAYSLYAAAIALCYATPLAGGLLADRVLGLHRCIIIGSFCMMAGYACLAQSNLQLFYWGLALIITGTGLFKSNISTLVGSLYAPQDSGRDAGYTLFYVSINVGAFIAPLACSFLSHVYGWSYGLGLSSFGMLLCLVIFLKTVKSFVADSTRRDEPWLRRFPYRQTLFYIGLVAAVPTLAVLLKHPELFDYTLPLLGLSTILILIVLAMSLHKEARQRLAVIALLMGFQIIFFALFEQAGSTLNLFAQRYINRQVFSFIIPASSLQSLNPAFTVFLAPALAGLWGHLGRKRRDPHPAFKFSLALFLMGAGFAALVIGVSLSSASPPMPLIWVLLAFLFHSLGEFCLAPVGMSMVTKLAPKGLTSFIMGLWFSSLSVSHYLAGVIARFLGPSGEASMREGSLAAYGALFQGCMIIAFVAGTILLLLAFRLTSAFEKFSQPEEGE